MHREAWQLRKKVLGRDHPSTLESMNNLAVVLGSQGQYAKAETMHCEVLQLREKVLGRDHPSTLRSRNNLALVLDSRAKHDYGQADEVELNKGRRRYPFWRVGGIWIFILSFLYLFAKGSQRTTAIYI